MFLEFGKKSEFEFGFITHFPKHYLQFRCRHLSASLASCSALFHLVLVVSLSELAVVGGNIACTAGSAAPEGA